MNDLKLKIEEYLTSTGISANELARRAGVNSASITGIRNNSNKPTKIDLRKLSLFFFGEIHVDTANYLNILGLCNRVKAESIRFGIDGFTGAGKTYSLQKYTKDTKQGVYYILCTSSLSVRTFTKAVAKAIGIEKGDMPGDRYELERKIAGKIMDLSKDSPVLLIFDEAEYLKPAAWLALKTLCDLLENKCGIVVAGCDIKEKLEILSCRKDSGFKQLVRRFRHKWENMLAMSPEEVEAFANNYDVTDKEVIHALCHHCPDYDSLKVVLTDATNFASKKNKPLTIELLFGLFPEFSQDK